jgi:Fe-Mn family superoxide dismutase
MTNAFDLERRTALKGAAIVLAASVADVGAQTPEKKTMSFAAFDRTATPKPLPFDPAKLNGISERLIRSHWENNYSGAVKALNTVNKQLAQALPNKDIPPYIYNDMKREHLIRTGSVVFHEYYFENLGGSGVADAKLRSSLADAFGSYDNWETEFRQIGNGLGGGSGWTVLGYNVHRGVLENYWMADHAHGPATTLPILVMDMYEHAYQMDYGAAAGKYIDAFFTNINWEIAAARLERVQSSAKLIA